MMKKKYLRFFGLVGLLLGLTLLFGCGSTTDGGTTEDAVTKHISVEISADGETLASIEGETTADNLGDFLLESGSVVGERGPYGLFIKSVQGREADQGEQEWWCVTKEGESVQTGVDSTPLADGDKFELTLKQGY